MMTSSTASRAAWSGAWSEAWSEAWSPRRRRRRHRHRRSCPRPRSSRCASPATRRSTPIRRPAKVCVAATGAIEQVHVLKSSGFPAYDEALRAGVRAWRYRPFVINGSAAKVCSIVNFIYSQH